LRRRTTTQETTHERTRRSRQVGPARLGRARGQRSAGLAQQNIDKLKQMKVASTDLNIPTVPQTGKNADHCART
jgi:hypothetical protein